MSELKHSSLPWWRSKLHPDWIIGYRDGMEAVLATEVFQPADAEYIVLACNAHYDLTAQLAAKDETISKLREGLGDFLADCSEAPMYGPFYNKHYKESEDVLRALLAETEVGKDTAHVVKQEVKE